LHHKRDDTRCGSNLADIGGTDTVNASLNNGLIGEPTLGEVVEVLGLEFRGVKHGHAPPSGAGGSRGRSKIVNDHVGLRSRAGKANQNNYFFEALDLVYS